MQKGNTASRAQQQRPQPDQRGKKRKQGYEPQEQYEQKSFQSFSPWNRLDQERERPLPLPALGIEAVREAKRSADALYEATSPATEAPSWKVMEDAVDAIDPAGDLLDSSGSSDERSLEELRCRVRRLDEEIHSVKEVLKGTKYLLI